jgi:hypothetical protein
MKNDRYMLEVTDTSIRSSTESFYFILRFSLAASKQKN